jgi:hypothetical protein
MQTASQCHCKTEPPIAAESAGASLYIRDDHEAFAAICVLAAVAGSAAFGQEKWVGKWALVPQKSTFGAMLLRPDEPGLTIVSQTMRIEQTAREIRLSGDSVLSDSGKSYHDDTSLSLDGRETVMGPGSLSFRRNDDSAFDIASKLNTGNINFSEVSHFAFSPDGRTLTETKTQTLQEVVPEGAEKSTGAVIKTSTFVPVFSKAPV